VSMSHLRKERIGTASTEDVRFLRLGFRWCHDTQVLLYRVLASSTRCDGLRFVNYAFTSLSLTIESACGLLSRSTLAQCFPQRLHSMQCIQPSLCRREKGRMQILLILVPYSQNSHTHANKAHTNRKKPNHTFQPTPVRSAIRSILFIVPRNLTPVPSNWSLIVCARLLESRISSPIAMVNCFSCPTFCDSNVVAVVSFCDSSDSSTDVAYCPRLLGVAGRKPEIGGLNIPFAGDCEYGESE